MARRYEVIADSSFSRFRASSVPASASSSSSSAARASGILRPVRAPRPSARSRRPRASSRAFSLAAGSAAARGPARPGAGPGRGRRSARRAPATSWICSSASSASPDRSASSKSWSRGCRLCGLLDGQPRPGVGGALEVLLPAQLGGQRRQQPPAVLPREGLQAPAQLVEGRHDLQPAPGRRQPHAGQPQLDPVAELLPGPVQQGLAPRRISARRPCRISSSAWMVQGLGSLGNRPRSVSISSRPPAPPAALLQQQPGAQQLRLDRPGRRRRRLVDQLRRPPSQSRCDSGAGGSGRSAARPGARPAAARRPRAAVVQRLVFPRTPRRGRPGSISAWIHPSRVVGSFGLVL